MQGKGPGDADALPLPPTEGVWKAPHVLRPQPDHAQEFSDAFLTATTALHAMHQQRLPDDIEQRHARIQRRKRILEDHLHVAPQPPQFTFREPGDINLLSRRRAEQHLTSGGLYGSQDTARGCRLAAAALAHQPEGFAFVQRKTYAIDGAHVSHCTLPQALANGEKFLLLL